MNIDMVQDSFKQAVCNSVELFPEGVDRYRVLTPFHFDDGDHFVIALRKENRGTWIITDEGHTYMHMSYHMNLSSLKGGPRNKIIEGTLEKHGVRENEGKIFAAIENWENAGNIFYSFIQCLMSITNVSYLNSERGVSTLFMDDFRNFIETKAPAGKFEFNYCNQKHDPQSKYLVDCRINGRERPLHLYAIKTDARCRDSTIGILRFLQWNTPFFAMGIFEDQEQINRKVLSRFTDVCDRQFSSLAENQERIEKCLQEHMS